MTTPEIPFENAALARMRNGELALGLVVRAVRSGEIVSIAAASGHDFLFVDTQHALFSLETIGHIAQAALGAGVAAIVRVPRHDDPDIGRLLDAAVSGIIVADVATAEQARAVVAACRFPPLGRRSVQTTWSQVRYRPFPAADLLRALERQTLVGCMIETMEGVENLDAIASVEGVDLIHLGCTDLLADLGRPGAFDDPALAAIVERAVQVCAARGRFLGIGGERDLGRLAALARRGLRFYTTQTDITYLIQAASERTRALRELVAAGD